MSKLTHFVTYNNLVPITISVVLLGSSASYAYNNPEVVYDRNERVVTIDNTHIAAVDFDTFSPSVEILSVEEDDDTYYVSYRFTTIALVDSVWQNVVSDEELVIPKANLGAYRDLGLYVTKELRELVLAEEKRLRDTQVFEKKNVTRKQLAIEYSGIIGGRLSPEVQTIDGYDPQVVAPTPNPERQNLAGPDSRSTVSKPIAISTPPPTDNNPAPPPAAPVSEAPAATDTDTDTDTDAAATGTSATPTTPATPATNTPASSSATSSTGSSTGSGNGGGNGGGSSRGGQTSTSSNTNTGVGTSTGANPPSPATTPASTSSVPTITLLGDSTVELTVGDSYTELGIVTADMSDEELTTDITVNGSPVEAVTIDTSTPGDHTITYLVENATGGTATVTRTVSVVATVEEVTDTVSVTTTPSASTTTDTPLPSNSAPAPASDSMPEAEEEETVAPAATSESEASGETAPVVNESDSVSDVGS